MQFFFLNETHYTCAFLKIYRVLKGCYLFELPQAFLVYNHLVIWPHLTFIKDLGGDDYFGECAFFSQQIRKCTARSKTITEVIKLSRPEFMQYAE